MRSTVVLFFVYALAFANCLSFSHRHRLAAEAELSGYESDLAYYKLPDDLQPVHYAIKIIPYMEEAPYPKNFTYEGEVGITIKVLKPTNLIRMHAHNMTIYNETVTVTDEVTKEKLTVASVNRTEPDDDRQFLDIILDEDLEQDKNYVVNINFEGFLNSDLAGFYRSGYQEDGKQKWMLVTQFEPTAARRAFPCFDEPALKATFEVSIARQQNWTVLSNMPMISETEVDTPGVKGLTWVNFKQTLKMSTYLAAFAVSQFESVTSSADDRFKIWARPELILDAEFAAEVAPKVVQCMENFTQHKYDMPKSDHIAVQDFEYGAMENWGLITYREAYLLYNEENSTTYSKQIVASVIAHELSHQWFGNLVSPKWWSNLWLNEGFATFLENYAGSCAEPELAYMEQFLIDPLTTALNADAVESAHPLVATVASPSEIKAIFDNFSYSKGGSVIRMMFSILGEENFWKGLRAYLEEMKFSNADHNDLWRGLSTAVPDGLLPKNVQFKDIMDTWALQAGYPVVTVTRDYDKNTASFTQKRFFIRPAKEEHNEVYWVPLTMVVQDAPTENSNIITWLHNETITVDAPSSDKWILVNNEKNGYYRVNYDKKNWEKLSESINGKDKVTTLSANNRAQLLMDSFNLAYAKELDYETAYLTTNYLQFEMEYTPWTVILDELSYIYTRMYGNKNSVEAFKKFMRAKMNHLYKHVNGFKESASDEHTLRLLRIRALSWLCEMEYEDCNKDAVALFNEWKNNNLRIHPDLKSIVLKEGMRMGGMDEYNFLYNVYNETTESKYMILSAMAASKKKDVLLRMLQDSIAEESPFKTHDALTILGAVRANPVGTDLALDFVIDNYFIATDQWGDDGIAFRYVAYHLNTEDQKQKIADFLQTHNETLTDGARRNIDFTLTTLEKHIEWNSQFHETVEKILVRNAAPLAGLSNVVLVFTSLILSKLLL